MVRLILANSLAVIEHISISVSHYSLEVPKVLLYILKYKTAVFHNNVNTFTFTCIYIMPKMDKFGK